MYEQLIDQLRHMHGGPDEIQIYQEAAEAIEYLSRCLSGRARWHEIERLRAEIKEFERRQSEVELITEDDQTELKRCPFCGSDATEYKQLEHDGQIWNAIKCVKCGATGPDYIDGLERKELAATAWNLRAGEERKED